MRISTRLFVSFLISLLLILATIKSVLASVSVVEFIAIASSTGVEVDWKTDTEQNNSGFYIQRSTTQSSGYQRISSFIPSQSDREHQTTYSFLDDNVVTGQTYYYRLEAIDSTGISQFFGPVSLIFGVNTATPTATLTATRTATATLTGGAGTMTPTPVVTATGTTFTATVTSTLTISPTTTLIPPPIFELEFPTPDRSQLISASSTPIVVQQIIAQPTPSISLGALSSRLKLLGVIVVLLWLSLASFLVFLVRKISP